MADTATWSRGGSQAPMRAIPAPSLAVVTSPIHDSTEQDCLVKVGVVCHLQSAQTAISDRTGGWKSHPHAGNGIPLPGIVAGAVVDRVSLASIKYYLAPDGVIGHSEK